MLHKLYTVFDEKSGAYLPPFVAVSNGSAVRSFADACNDPNTSFHKHPGDFTLFLIGEYDDQTGMLAPIAAHANLGKAIEYKET